MDNRFKIRKSKTAHPSTSSCESRGVSMSDSNVPQHTIVDADFCYKRCRIMIFDVIHNVKTVDLDGRPCVHVLRFLESKKHDPKKGNGRSIVGLSPF